jgi:choline dehydrogenase
MTKIPRKRDESLAEATMRGGDPAKPEAAVFEPGALSTAEPLGSAFSRREFGRRSAMLAVAAAGTQLDGCASPEDGTPATRPSTPTPTTMAGPSISFEYIVVGSGAGGGPLAANLARAGRKVLLIEAGAAKAGGLNYQVPVFHAAACDDPAMQWNYFVRHWAKPPAPDSKYVAAEGGIWYPRAGTLGGCTAHNAMITVYPDDADWDTIAAATDDSSWSSERMRRYFERLERCEYRPRWLDSQNNLSGHGYDGWLPTSQADPLLVLPDDKLVHVIEAAAKSVGIGGLVHELLNGRLDPNDIRSNAHRREGLFLTPLAVSNGSRYGTRDYIEATVRDFPDNLTVLTGALVTRVLLEGQRAIGVEYLLQDHAYRADPNASRPGPSWAALAPVLRSVRASREVILAAGAFNSPQLLMLSGIGPRSHLEENGIPVLIERDGVGLNLQDRYEVGVISQFDSEFELLRGCKLHPPMTEGDSPDPCLDTWQRERTGPYATNGVVIGIVRRSRSGRVNPDLYIFGLPGAFRGYYPGFSGDAVKKDHLTWAILKAHTNNTAGQVRLRSADPRDTPDILFRYFEEGNDAAGDDLDAVVAGVEFVRSINQRLGRLSPIERVPGPDVATPDQIADFVRREAWGHHASCSNKIGPASDPLAVVDSEFRVHGVQGLRVVDASVFPRIPGFFIAAAVYMISEKATDAILAA